MKILFLSSWFPYPPDNGSKIRIYNLLRGLARSHEITLLTFSRESDFEKHLPTLQEICRKVEVARWKEFNPTSFRAISALVNPKPRSIVGTFSLQMERLVRQELVPGHDYDLVIASQLTMTAYLHNLGEIPVLIEEIELAIIRDQMLNATSSLERFRKKLTWLKTSRYVAHILKQAKVCTVVSENEKRILSEIAPTYRSIEMLPNCLDYDEYQNIQSNPEPATLIFTGALTYAANLDALTYFVREIFPLIKQEMPQTVLRVTGRYDGVKLPPEANDPNVELAGYVDDIKTLIANSCVSIVPLRVGGGTRLKILEAFALGTPVVSTSKGAEGLDAISEKHLLVADTPQAFATATLRVLREPQLRIQLVQEGRVLVHNNFNWQTAMPKFLSIVAGLQEGVGDVVQYIG